MHDIYFSFAEKIVLGLGIITCLASFIYEVSRRLLIVFKGLGTLPFDRFGARFWRMFREVFLHEKVVKGRPIGPDPRVLGPTWARLINSKT